MSDTAPSALEDVLNEPAEDIVDQDEAVEVVVEEEEPSQPRAEFNQEQIEAQEDEDAKDIDKYPRPIKKRFETLTYHVRERERQIAEEKKVSEALLEYGNGAKSAIEALAKENAELRNSLKREALAAREAQLAATQNDFLAARESADTAKEVAAAQRLAELTQQRAQIEQYQVPGAWQPPPPPHRSSADSTEIDPVTAGWLQRNKWFQEDGEMQGYAVYYSGALAKQGVAPETETYYNRIDAEMRKRFPDRFETGAMTETAKPQQSAKPTSRPPVATASRTNGAANGTRKIALSADQMAAARKLNLTKEEFARYVHLVKE